MNGVHEANVLSGRRADGLRPPRNPYGAFEAGMAASLEGDQVAFAGDGLYRPLWQDGYTVWVRLPDGYYDGPDLLLRQDWARSYGVVGGPRRITAAMVGLPAMVGVVGDLRAYEYGPALAVVDAALAVYRKEAGSMGRLKRAVRGLS